MKETLRSSLCFLLIVMAAPRARITPISCLIFQVPSCLLYPVPGEQQSPSYGTFMTWRTAASLASWVTLVRFGEINLPGTQLLLQIVQVVRLQMQSASGCTTAWQVHFLGHLPGLMLAECHHLTRPV